MELVYKVQNYKWGKIGMSSKVASLINNTFPDFKINPQEFYAELWLGTHPNGPSKLKTNNTELSELIKQHPEYLGDKCLKTFNGDLPFLLKVLSINTALSIQVHPSKLLAEELHAKLPHLYKDDNHKPELVIALTPMVGMCGFRPIKEIKNFLNEIPELFGLINKCKTMALINSDIQNYERELKDYFYALMNCEKEHVSKAITHLIERLEKEDLCKQNTQQYKLFLKLNSQYPNDVGCFCIYFFNIITLAPYESMYLPANEPHAYISGDCVECMACSDNVIRAGLTEKFKDVDTLCKMLNYVGEPMCAKIFKPKVEGEFSKIFQPNIPDFAVAQINIPASVKTYKLIKRDSASIILVIEGSGCINETNIKPGVALFIPAPQEETITNISNDLLLFQAFANL